MQPPVPPAFLARMAALLGDEYAAFAASYDAPPVVGLRVNTLKTKPADLRSRLPFALNPVPWSSDAFVVAGGSAPDESRPGKHPYHAAGLYYLQDPSALIPVLLLDPQPGELVLDLSAAPGGKATHVASLLQGEGVLIANEVVNKRAWELAGNLERWGAANVAITMESPERLADHFGAIFDAVLVDAPCSGEGMFRKSAAARQDWSPALVEGCSVRQVGILDAAARLVRPGGRLVYSTCTFAPEEDETTVATFLRRHGEFGLASPPVLPAASQGRPDWLQQPGLGAPVENALRIWPHRGPGEGHFAALLMREAGAPARMKEHRLVRLPKGALDALQSWWAAALLGSVPQGLLGEGSYLYSVPPGLPDLAGLRTIHPGFWLGALKPGRFEPSHALALTLNSDRVRDAVDLEGDSSSVQAYLRGEVLEGVEGEDGWVLVTVDGYGLGWGKRSNGRVKNLYPKGLRWN